MTISLLGKGKLIPKQPVELTFFIDNLLKPKIKIADIRPALIKHTDHQAISLKINLNFETKGKGFFKINNSVLKDENYKKRYRKSHSKSHSINSNKEKDLLLVLNLLKNEIREQTVKFCKIRARNTRNILIDLEKKLVRLDEAYQNSNSESLKKYFKEQLENVKTEIENKNEGHK